MIKKILLIALIVTGLYWRDNWNKPVTPTEKPAINQTALTTTDSRSPLWQYLPAKEKWPEFLRVMYYMVYIKDAIDPIRARADYLPLDSVGIHVQHAIIAVEDHNFYQHNAISAESITRAFMVNTSAGEVLQGGSTITQQLAKNLFLNNKQTINRKIMEAMLAIVLEKNYSKDEILELYLNSVFFGMSCTGINQASDRLFGKAPIILKLEEAALLAGLPNAPLLLNPFENPQGAKKRQEIVLNAMQQFGFITQSQCLQAKTNTLYLKNGTTIEYVDKVAL